MADSMLTFAAEGILTKVTKLAASEFSLVLGFKGDLADLRASFLKIQAMLKDLDHSHDRGKALQIWVKELEDIAEIADDVLDNIAYEVLRRQAELQNHIKKKVLNFFSRNNPIVFRIKMAHKIKNITTSLAKLNEQAPVYNLVANTTSEKIEELHRETISAFKPDNEKFIVGREGAVSKVVITMTKSNYSSEENNLPVLAVVGMAGLGKTTFAKLVYHEPAIDSHFPVKIWVCVSTRFDVNKILKAILECLKPERAGVQNKEAICTFLREELKDKRYLLVLDDVWNEDAEEWKELKSCLLSVCDDRGSSVIVTTRSRKVAEIMETLPRCDLRELSDEDCWLILKEKAVPVGSAPLSEEQETIGREIAKKCGGVPLAAKVLGDVMRSKTSGGWQSIVKSDIWDSSEGDVKIMPILKLSFDELKASSLKKCFAYCSMFITDFDIEKDDLIQLWMAQGWLHPCSDKSVDMEERGNEYFNILLAKSFFQNAEEDYSGSVTKCKMHDLVHELAKLVSKTDSSRSLFSDGEDLESNLMRFRSLRVLNLYEADIEVLPVSIGKLKQLRYLNVLRTRVKAFPSSIGKLYNLQTLKIPSQVEEFPKEFANLVNLRHLYFGRYIKIPTGILGRLTNLRSVPFVKVKKEMSPRLEELGGLDQLRGTLSISGLENVRDGSESRKANLMGKKHLCKLFLEWSPDRPDNNVANDQDVLEGLFKPKEGVADQGVLPTEYFKLQFLEIHRFEGLKFPSGLLLASNLIDIRLVDCNKCERLPTLGHLPNLRSVKIKNMVKLTCIGPEFYGVDDHVYYEAGTSKETKRCFFPALKTLRIKGACNLIEWWEVPTEKAIAVFPCLEELIIRCETLMSAPSHFPSLKKLVVDFLDGAILDKGDRQRKAGKTVASILSDQQLTTLTHLELEHVEGLTCLPEGVLEKNKNLAYLHLYGCRDLTCVAPPHGSAYCCSSLRSLNISQCDKLGSLPAGLLTDSLEYFKLWGGDLESFPDISSNGDGGLTSLETLLVFDCFKLTSIPALHGDGGGLPKLRYLSLRSCPELVVPSGVLDPCPSLEYLEITHCPAVTSFLTESALDTLCVSDPDSLPLGRFNSLRHLRIQNCESKEIRLELSASLQELTISSCDNLETIPSLEKLTRLRSLTIEDCYQLKRLPSGLAAATSSSPVSCSSSLTSLKKLTMGPFCADLESFPAFQVIPNLESLRIDGRGKLKSLPEQIHRFSSLRELTVAYFGLEALPEWLGELVSLQYLKIVGCRKLTSLPSHEAMLRLINLKQIVIFDCALLEERCKEETGEEWDKIRHLPLIEIDDRVIENY